MSKIDMHIHSRHSNDGEFSIKKILEMCAENNMELVSITDHNSVQGSREALKLQEDTKKLPRVISGVELDCEHRGINFHLLGYGFDHSGNEFDIIGEDIARQEQKASGKKIALFTEATGIPLDREEILSSAKNGIITGEAIGGILLAKESSRAYGILKQYLPGGEKSDMPNVHIYWDYFAPGKAAYVPVHYISMTKAIDLIHKKGGIAVLAHPGQNLGGDYGTLDSVIAEGIDGIEVFSSYHSAEDAARFLDNARQNKLLISCGSDFHGKNKPRIPLGGHAATLDDAVLLTAIKARLGL